MTLFLGRAEQMPTGPTRETYDNPKLRVPPKSNSVNGRVLLGLFTGICLRRYFRNDWITIKLGHQKPTPTWLGAHKCWKCETHCRVWRKAKLTLRLLSCLSLFLPGGQSEPLLGSSACTECLKAVPSAGKSVGEEGAAQWIGWGTGLWGSFGIVCLLSFNELPCRVECFPSPLEHSVS